MSDLQLASIELAVERIRAGRFVIVVDDEDRENEGDLVIAADFATPEAVNFMATQGRGLICLAMLGEMLDRLQIPMMVDNRDNTSGFGTPFTVSVEAVEGVTTGISAPDRAQTIATMINPSSTRKDIAIPGHIFPLRARDRGVLERRGQTEASVDLARLAGLSPAGVICEVMSADGTMARLPELLEFGQKHDIPVVTVEALAQYRLAREDSNVSADLTQRDITSSTSSNLVSPGATCRLPTRHGEFTMTTFRDLQGNDHSALVYGNIDTEIPLVRLHSECLTGDAFGSLRCDCGSQLDKSLAMIVAEGAGILLYMRQEGRGIGLGNKIRAYALQDDGLDTVEANHQLGFPADGRSYEVAAAMLTSLRQTCVRLITNNPVKVDGLQGAGVQVSARIPLIITAQKHNVAYLRTKATRMGHTLPVDQQASGNEGDPESEDSEPVQVTPRSECSCL